MKSPTLNQCHSYYCTSQWSIHWLTQNSKTGIKRALRKQCHKTTFHPRLKFLDAFMTNAKICLFLIFSFEGCCATLHTLLALYSGGKRTQNRNQNSRVDPSEAGSQRPQGSRWTSVPPRLVPGPERQMFISVSKKSGSWQNQEPRQEKPGPWRFAQLTDRV